MVLTARNFFKGIIANFKAMFRWNQYMRAINRYIENVDVDHTIGYRMDKVEAMFYVAQSWQKIKPETIAKCWKHTNILSCKEAAAQSNDEVEDSLSVALPTEALPPLEQYVVDKYSRDVNFRDLPGNYDEKSDSLLVSSIDDLNLEADEDTLLVTQPVDMSEVVLSGMSTDEPNSVEAITEAVSAVIEEEEEVDVGKARSELKRAFQTLLQHTICADDEDHQMMKYARRKINEIEREEIAQMKQTDVRQYFFPSSN